MARTSERVGVLHSGRALADVTTPTARRELLTWLEEAAVEKDRAEGALDDITRAASAPVLSADDILAVLAQHGGLVSVLEHIGDDDRAALYDAMHVTVVFDPGGNEVRLGVDPVASTVCRRTVESEPHWRIVSWDNGVDGPGVSAR